MFPQIDINALLHCTCLVSSAYLFHLFLNANKNLTVLDSKVTKLDSNVADIQKTISAVTKLESTAKKLDSAVAKIEETTSDKGAAPAASPGPSTALRSPSSVPSVSPSAVPSAVPSASPSASAAPVDETLSDLIQAVRFLVEQAKKAKKTSSRSSGDYFAINDEVWEKDVCKDDGAWEQSVSLIQDKILRDKPPFLKSYKMPTTTEIESVMKGGGTLVPDPDGHLRNTKSNIFGSTKLNIFLTRASTSHKDASSTFNSFAHAVPRDLACSVFWSIYLPILTGEGKCTELQRFHAVHGLGENEDEFRGLKNLPHNLLALPPNHGGFFGNSSGGNLIIVPIVDLDNTDLCSDNYELLVIPKGKPVHNWIYNGLVAASSHPYSDSPDDGVEEATKKDVEIATKFLAHYVKAAAHFGLKSTAELPDEDDEAMDVVATFGEEVVAAVDKIAMDKQNKRKKDGDDGASSVRTSVSGRTANIDRLGMPNKLEKIQKVLNEIRRKGLFVPKLVEEFDCDERKVMKVKLTTYFRKAKVSADYYPAWSMLGLKAAANWFVFSQQAFLPSGLGIDADVPVSSVEF